MQIRLKNHGRDVDINNIKPEKWNAIGKHFENWNLATECEISTRDFGRMMVFCMVDGDNDLDIIEIPTNQFNRLSIEDIDELFTSVANRPYGKHRKVLQHIYNYFREHNEWPNSRSLRVELMPNYGDLFKLEKEIGEDWIVVEKRQKEDRDWTYVSLKAISLCTGSEEDLNVFLRVVKFLAKEYMYSKGHPLPVGASELCAKNNISKEEFMRLSLILEKESWVLSTMTNDPKSHLLTSCAPSDHAIHFLDIQTIDDYFQIEREVWGVDKSEQIEPLPPPPTGTNITPVSVNPLPKRDILADILTDKGLLEKCSPQFEAENYYEAVLTALTYYELRMRSFNVSRKKSGPLANILQKLFNATNGSYHFPFCVEPDDPNERGHQNGMMNLYLGIASMRNLTSHHGIPVDKTDALNLIGFVNFLLETGKKARRGALLKRTKGK